MFYLLILLVCLVAATAGKLGLMGISAAALGMTKILIFVFAVKWLLALLLLLPLGYYVRTCGRAA